MLGVRAKMNDDQKVTLSPFAPIDGRKQVTDKSAHRLDQSNESDSEEVFAQGLPDWNLVPKHSVIRRH
jgi:hypothetical protein